MKHYEEMVYTFLSHKTRKLKNKVNNKIGEIISFEKFGMDFRLIRTTRDNISFEIICFDKDLKCIYTKPIGFFHSNGEIYILKEFENSYHKLINNKIIPVIKEINFLTTIENAMIGAFSIEAIYYAMKMKDTTFYANGLDMEIWLTNEGDSQSFLNDKYGIRGPIAGYDFRNGKENAWSILEHYEMFKSLLEKKLLTIYNRI